MDYTGQELVDQLEKDRATLREIHGRWDKFRRASIKQGMYALEPRGRGADEIEDLSGRLSHLSSDMSSVAMIAGSCAEIAERIVSRHGFRNKVVSRG